MADIPANAALIFMFLYLLPGFVGQAMYFYLCEAASPDAFGRVLNAFIITLPAVGLANWVFDIPLVPVAALDEKSTVIVILNALVGKNLLYVSAIALVIAIAAAVAKNHGWILWAARRIRMTYKNDSLDVWQDAFYKNRGVWIRLRYTDGKILEGWPQFFSNAGKSREIFVAKATWWEPGGEEASMLPTTVEGPGVYVGDFSRVVAIELLEGSKGENNGNVREKAT
jgi:Family of unknown function (DUF6338)